MADLSFRPSGMDEEQSSAIHTALYQVWVYREIIRRTGLHFRADEYGWVWGDPQYFGLDPFRMYIDQLTSALRILNIPLNVSDVHVGDAGGPDEGIDEMVPLDPDSSYEPLTEEDFVLWFESSDQAMLDHYRIKLSRIHEKRNVDSVFGRYEFWKWGENDQPRTLAETFAREEGEPSLSFGLVIRDATMESETYTYELIFEFIEVWKEDNFVGKHAAGRSRHRHGRDRHRRRSR